MKKKQVYVLALATAIMSTAVPVNGVDVMQSAIVSQADSAPSLSVKSITVKPGDEITVNVNANGVKILSCEWNCDEVTNAYCSSNINQTIYPRYRGAHKIECTVKYKVGKKVKKKKLVCNVTVAGEYDAELVIKKNVVVECKNKKKVTRAIIPEGVTKIADKVFYGCYNLDTVTLPKSLTSIGKYAFGSCKISSIDLPNSLETVDTAAFSNCPLYEVELPKGLKNIGEKAFDLIFAEDVTIPAGVTSLGYDIFGDEYTSLNFTVDENNPVYRCENNCIVEKETNALVATGKYAEIPSSVKTIKYGALKGLRFADSITIPEGVEELEAGAFASSYIKEIILPSSLKKISGNPVTYSVEEIKFSNENSKYAVVDDTIMEKETGKVVCAWNDGEIPTGAICLGKESYQYVDIRSLNIPATCTKIENKAINTNKLNKITIDSANPVLKLQDNGKTIMDTTSNTVVLGIAGSKIGENVEVIGAGAYYKYEEDSEFQQKLPTSVQRIEDSAFEYAGCKLDGKTVLGPNVTYIGERAFYKAEIGNLVIIPDSVTYIGKDAFCGWDDSELRVKWKGITYMSPKTFLKAFHKEHPLKEEK
ncbi:MAG: leucine-rich repeat domain-containing protein [Lachnospiraceae bacterium]|nr:leucine-rich repeat domain-containing protein [Lachnospiraceae bacterium]